MRKRYVQIDGELIEISDDYSPPVAPMVQGEIQPYQNMVDGGWIQSRAEHRELLKRTGLVELGNEKIAPKQAKPSASYVESRKQAIQQMVNHYGEDRIRRDAKALGEHLRWNMRGRA